MLVVEKQDVAHAAPEDTVVGMAEAQTENLDLGSHCGSIVVRRHCQRESVAESDCRVAGNALDPAASMETQKDV